MSATILVSDSVGEVNVLTDRIQKRKQNARKLFYGYPARGLIPTQNREEYRVRHLSFEAGKSFFPGSGRFSAYPLSWIVNLLWVRRQNIPAARGNGEFNPYDIL